MLNREEFYMNPKTGAIDNLEGWHPYTPGDGLVLVEKNSLGDWVEVEEGGKSAHIQE